MKKILVLYFSQTGQLTEIVKSVLSPVEKSQDISLVFEELRPKRKFPFPWTSQQFCDVFPESFQEIPCELEPFHFNADDNFDLIVLAYTVWYMSPSIPVTAFLQSPEAQKVIKNRPVVTVIGCRNMWLLAQEKVKTRIYDMGGRIAGNIVLMDKAKNLVGIATIAYWMFTGKKDRCLKILPRPGVSETDIKDAERFGHILLKGLSKDKIDIDQTVLNEHGAICVLPSYIIFEKRILKVFKIWSNFILQKGGPGDPNRSFRVRLFLYYLLVAIFLIAPLATLVSFVARIVNRKNIKEAVEYFSQNALKH
ncbi:MAG: dialkylresorcinol condensing enzyme [Desulfobacterales bacterium]|nr:dialkylresorcinol condensing enzyme [Desulfobacterales bacterium]MDX2508814.1 dialkylresorcinol condensing enzyme [Desulfobacterales bacterium]